MVMGAWGTKDGMLAGVRRKVEQELGRPLSQEGLAVVEVIVGGLAASGAPSLWETQFNADGSHIFDEHGRPILARGEVDPSLVVGRRAISMGESSG